MGMVKFFRSRSGSRKTSVSALASALLFALTLGVIAQDTAVNPGARLREGDQIEIRLGGVPSEEIMQVTGMYQVDGQGFLNLPHVGKVKASGLSQSELQNAIEGAYKKSEIYTHPTVTVNVPTQARFVNVGGEVKTERRVEYTPDLTIIAAINGASGFTEFANQSRVQLIRVGQEKPMIINVKAARKKPELDVQLEPGDRIFVPRSFW